MLVMKVMNLNDEQKKINVCFACGELVEDNHKCEECLTEQY